MAQFLRELVGGAFGIVGDLSTEAFVVSYFVPQLESFRAVLRGDRRRVSTSADSYERPSFRARSASAGTSTGDTIEEMNRAAEESILRNVRPDESTG